MMKHVKVHVQEVTREGWMKHVPNGREESETARDWDPRTHEKTARDWDPPGPMKKEHSQQQADKYL